MRRSVQESKTMSTTSQHLAELSFAAEIRAKENGHHAILRSDRTVSIKSDTTEGLHWIVRAFTASEAGEPIVFECRADNPVLAEGRGHLPLVSRTPGACCCQHAATAAHRLEREGLAVWVGGVWVATAKAVGPVDSDGDPFAGFPA